jgi:hypothetical protein
MITLKQFELGLEQFCWVCGQRVSLNKRSRFCSLEHAVQWEAEHEANNWRADGLRPEPKGVPVA